MRKPDHRRPAGSRPAPRKADKPSVTSYADHDVISVPNPLEKFVHRIDGAADDPVARAEQALQNLSVEFDGWMNDELVILERTRAAIAREGVTKPHADALFRAAHDIKGDGATFGYPLAAAAAESLCRIIEHAPDHARLPLPLIDYHIDAIAAIVREHDRIGADEVAQSLVGRLREVADDYLIQVNQDRPEHLVAIRSPGLAPR